MSKDCPENTGTDPTKVVAPRRYWKLVCVLKETEHWSLAFGEWFDYDGTARPVLAARWNGYQGSKGNPISSGHPTWFVIPDEMDTLFLGSDFIPTDFKPIVNRALMQKAADAIDAKEAAD